MIRRTKIVATIGPASSSREGLRELMEGGLNIARVTLAHGTVASQKELIATIREVADATGRPVGILLDLPGPKVRTTLFTGTVELQRGDVVTLVPGDTQPSTAATLVIDYATLVDDIQVGDLVSIGDGIVHLLVEMKTAGALITRVVHGGHLTGRKGVNIPSTRFRANVPTDDDLDLIAAFRDCPIDIIAVSFVRSGADMEQVRLAAGPQGPWLMAKVETAAAIDNLSGIIAASDAVMVARGDLGNELPIEDVPHLQKRIIRETVRQGKPVLVATQMLESMIESPTPTRAEASDVANAVLDQASAVMLSAETAIGRDPGLVVRTMDRMLRRAEDELTPTQLQIFALENRDLSDVNVATAHAGWQAANDVRARAILCCTRTGATARKMSSFRPLVPIYGLAADARALRQLSLCWGVQPLFLPHLATSTEGVMQAAIHAAKTAGVVAVGDMVVIVAGSPEAGPGHTDSVRVTAVT
ncbi:MAG: pyruvate kinase [Acidobacteriota bacterium]